MNRTVLSLCILIISQELIPTLLNSIAAIVSRNALLIFSKLLSLIKTQYLIQLWWRALSTCNSIRLNRLGRVSHGIPIKTYCMIQMSFKILLTHILHRHILWESPRLLLIRECVQSRMWGHSSAKGSLQISVKILLYSAMKTDIQQTKCTLETKSKL